VRSSIEDLTRRLLLRHAQLHPRYPGICHECGCTEITPCVVESLIGQIPCGWVNKKKKTLCDHPRCTSAHDAKIGRRKKPWRKKYSRKAKPSTV
jgi:hypothetical protein